MTKYCVVLEDVQTFAELPAFIIHGLPDGDNIQSHITENDFENVVGRIQENEDGVLEIYIRMGEKCILQYY